MKLTKIIVYGLFGEYDYELSLCKEGLTYVHSPNGMGKSTLMRLVSETLDGNLEEVRTTPFDRLDFFFDDASYLIVENYNQELKVQISRNEVEEEISPDELVKILPCTYISPERIYMQDEKGNFVPCVSIYMKQFSEALASAIADVHLREIPDDGKKVSDAEVENLFRDLIARMDFIKQAGLEPEMPSGYRVPPSRYEISQYPDDYRALARSLKDWCDRYYRFAESVVVYKDIINSVFEDKTVEFNEFGFLEARLDRSGIVVPVDKFSSGEKQILLIFYLLLFKAASGSLVILDEPEVSLHVSWQQRLGKIFSDISRVRDLTMIVATHAPAVIHDSWDQAVELRNSRE